MSKLRTQAYKSTICKWEGTEDLSLQSCSNIVNMCEVCTIYTLEANSLEVRFRDKLCTQTDILTICISEDAEKLSL